jgi:hypothetical protein
MHARPMLAVLATVALALGLAAPTVADPGDRPRPELPTSASDRAREALADVRAIFNGDRPGAARTSAESGREATLALRELMRVRDRLTGAERRQADAFLARPTDGAADPMDQGYRGTADPRRTCSDTVCLHWVDTTADRPQQVDSDGDTVPDFVEQTLTTVTGVHATYVTAGYREPKPDGRRGGRRDLTDIYLADIGEEGMYGYCASDDLTPATYDVPAYCVLDNDYAEFPALTPVENMQVTAAHEYFHAVQFAYDAFEDGWFMEATATWAEDELFDDIDDNLQYLRAGPIGRPRVPLDKFEEFGSHQYGDWIFFRYLTEKYDEAVGGLPTLVRAAWDKADASEGAPDMFSIQAVKAALTARGTTFGRQFARFADANRRSRAEYSEGAANTYPKAPLWKERSLTRSARTAALTVDQLDHQSSATARFTPSGLTETDWRLRINVRMADRVRGSMAVVTEYRSELEPRTSLVDLNAAGDGRKTVPFSTPSVSAVEVTLVNASTRMAGCWQYGFVYSCLGVSRDDNLSERVSVTAYR